LILFIFSEKRIIDPKSFDSAVRQEKGDNSKIQGKLWYKKDGKDLPTFKGSYFTLYRLSNFILFYLFIYFFKFILLSIYFLEPLICILSRFYASPL
jgi:hypothetical protein